MLAKISNEATFDDLYAMDVSDTNTQMVTAYRAQNLYVRFYSYNGAFTLDTTVPLPTSGGKELINISSVTYIALFASGYPKYKIIHEITKKVIDLELNTG